MNSQTVLIRQETRFIPLSMRTLTFCSREQFWGSISGIFPDGVTRRCQILGREAVSDRETGRTIGWTHTVRVLADFHQPEVPWCPLLAQAEVYDQATHKTPEQVVERWAQIRSLRGLTPACTCGRHTAGGLA